MALSDVLQKAEQLNIVVETSIPSTIVHESSFEDWNAGGCIANAGHNTEIIYKSNSELRFSSAQARHVQTSEVLIDDYNITRSLGRPFSESGAVATSVSNVSLVNVESSDELSKRNYDDATAVVKVGGLLDKGKPTQEVLEYVNYETWLNGRLRSFAFDRDTIDLDMSMNSLELDYLFPAETIEGGSADGVAFPYTYGRTFGQTPVEISPGIHQFHTGTVDHSDDLFDPIPHYYFGDGLQYPQALEFARQGSTPGTPSASKVTSDFTFSQDSETEISADTYDTQVTTSSENVELEADGSSFRVKASDSVPNSLFNGDNFRWRKESNTKVVSMTNPRFTVELSGGLTVHSVAVPDPRFGTQWFKIVGNGTGTVTFTCDEVIRDAELYVRSVRQGAQLVDNWSHPPQSVTPTLPADLSAPTPQNPSRTINHLVKLNSLNNKTFSFDYEANSGSLLTVLWFKSVRVARPLTASIDVSFDRKTEATEFNLFGNLGTSTVVSGTSKNNIVAVSDGSLLVQMLEPQKQYRLVLDLSLGDVSVNIGRVEESLDQFGGYLDDGIVKLCPPPEFGTGPGGGTILPGTADVFLPAATREKSRLTFRARLVSDSVNEVLIDINGDSYKTIGNTFQEYSVIIGAGISSVRIGAYRGIFDHFTATGSINVSNPDVDHCIEIDRIQLEEASNTSSSIRVYGVEGGQRDRLKTYRVADSAKLPEAPTGVCAYDENGRLSASPSYSRIVGDFIGSDRDQRSIDAFRDISRRATGEDQITCDFVGEVVGFMVKDQTPWSSVVSKYCRGLDYYFIENEESSGITIRRRFDLNDYPSDFLVVESVIKHGSVERVKTDPRESQYKVLYRMNEFRPQESRSVKSRFGYSGKSEAQEIATPLIIKSNAISIAEKITRDSIENGIFTLTLYGLGHGISVGQAGVINHNLIPRRKPCLVMEVSEDAGLRETQMTVKVLQGGANG